EDAGRDAAAIIHDRARTIRIEGDRDFVGMAGERLVDAVVDDLVDHMVEAGAVIGVADIHAGALTHGVEALEDLDRLLVIGFAGDNRLDFVHELPLVRGPSGDSEQEDQNGRRTGAKTGSATPWNHCHKYSMSRGKFRLADKN